METTACIQNRSNTGGILGTQAEELTWTPEMVERFWFYEICPDRTIFFIQVGAALAGRFRRYFGRRAADYRAGPEFLVDDLLDAGIQRGAIEFSEAQIRDLDKTFRGRAGFLGAKTINNIMDWRGSFDTVFLIEVIEHLHDAELDICIKSATSLLKPGGVIILTTPNEENRSQHFICSPESGKIFHRFQHVRS
jgi:SAM-dependent methyltransferase